MALSTGIDAAEAWKIIRNNASNVYNQTPQVVTVLLNSDVTLDYVVSVYRSVRDSRNQLETLKATANLNAYVQDVRAEPGYDAVAEITLVTDAQQLVLDWIDTNASGLSLSGDTAENAIANGSIVTNRFTPAQTAPLRTLLTDVTALIS